VLLKTTRAVKQNGQIVIAKGSTLVGHVTDVQQKTKVSAASNIGVVFDGLTQGGTQTSITANITSILKAESSDLSGSESESGTYGSTQVTTRQAQDGPPIGPAVGKSIPTVANTLGQTIDTTANSAGLTGNAVHAAGSATTNIRGLSISQSTGASANGSSTLSMADGNLRLNMGTTFILSVSSK
jgi:hypothetical protein